MKQQVHDSLRTVFSNALLQTRKRLGFSQAAFAKQLQVDVRSYADLEHGRTLCGMITFLIYISTLCEDPDKLLQKMKSCVLTYNISKPRSS